MIIWDKIITSRKDALIKEKNEFVKYALIDQGNELRYCFYISLLISLHHNLLLWQKQDHPPEIGVGPHARDWTIVHRRNIQEHF